MKTQVIIFLITVALSPTVLFGQTAIFSADTLIFRNHSQKRKARIMESEWRIHGQTLHYGSKPLAIKTDKVMDTVFFRLYKNSTWDTLICNITEPKKYIFEYNECCDGFNICDDKNKLVTGSINFRVEGFDNKRLYLGTLGESGILIKEKNQILDRNCGSPMLPNFYPITFSEIEICKGTIDCNKEICLYEGGEFKPDHEFGFKTISLKLDFLFLPLGNQPINVIYNAKTGKIKIE